MRDINHRSILPTLDGFRFSTNIAIAACQAYSRTIALSRNSRTYIRAWIYNSYLDWAETKAANAISTEIALIIERTTHARFSRRKMKEENHRGGGVDNKGRSFKLSSTTARNGAFYESNGWDICTERKSRPSSEGGQESTGISQQRVVKGTYAKCVRYIRNGG